MVVRPIAGGKEQLTPQYNDDDDDDVGLNVLRWQTSAGWMSVALRPQNP